MPEIVSTTYGVHEAAVLLGCSDWKVYQMCKSGDLPHYKVGTTIRFTDVNLSKWMLNQERARCKNRT